MISATKMVFLASVLVFAAEAQACSPCPKQYTLQESLKEAEVLVIGTRTTLLSADEKTQAGGPETIQIAVEETLRGDVAPKQSVEALAWQGMCPYGMVVRVGQRMLMFLKRMPPGTVTDTQGQLITRPTYRAVYGDCGIKALALDAKNNVQLPDNTTQPLQAWEKAHGIRH